MDREQREWFDDVVERTQAEWDFIAAEERAAEAEISRQRMALLSEYMA